MSYTAMSTWNQAPVTLLPGVAEPYMEAECTFCLTGESLNSREEHLKDFQRAT
jgi:hypothetical protein